MRRLLPLALIVFLFAVPVLAGDVSVPGKTEPPPCTTNCTTSTTSSPTVTNVLLTILSLVKY